MTASRLQHVVSSSAVLVVALIVAWLSFTQEPSEAFLFPRLISIFFAGLAIWNFIRAASGLAAVGTGLAWPTIMNILPGLAIMLVYVFFAAQGLGFYVSSAVGFLIIYTLYDPAYLTDAGAWVKRVAVTAVFMAVIYGLFGLLLKVQTPRGIMF